jgi:sugar O-acyltransferase (sialic acid O-acetyltransferase NeuD family)
MATTYATQFQDDPQYDIVGFVENTPSPPGRSARSLPVYDIEDALALRETHGVLCAIGSPGRESLIQRFEDAGFEFATLVSPSAIVHDSESIESGCVISDLANIDPCVRIGRHTLVTSRVTVAHHTTIGPCSFLAPGATIGGHCKIGTRCFIGMGAIILDHITIGHDVTVGAGAVVTKDVPPGQTVVGIPARPLSKKDSAPIPLRHVRRPILILGAGGMARAIATNFRDNPLFEIAGFVQNSDPSAVKETAVGLPVYWVDDVMDLHEKYAVISVIGSREKRLLVQAFESAGFEFINLIAPTALVDRTAEVGVGCVVTHWASIETETSAGNHSFFGRHALLAHHTHIGAFSMVAPGSHRRGEHAARRGANAGKRPRNPTRPLVDGTDVNPARSR